MTLLKFLSAAAGAGIVSPDLGRVAFDLACCSVAAILVGHYEFLLAPAPFDLLSLLFFFNGLEEEKETERVFFNPAHEVFEQFVRFFFVLDQRLELSLTCQYCAFLEV